MFLWKLFYASMFNFIPLIIFRTNLKGKNARIPQSAPIRKKIVGVTTKFANPAVIPVRRMLPSTKLASPPNKLMIKIIVAVSIPKENNNAEKSLINEPKEILVRFFSSMGFG